MHPEYPNKPVPSVAPGIIDITDLDFPPAGNDRRTEPRRKIVPGLTRRTGDRLQTRKPWLTVIVPTRNERENIPLLLSRLFGTLEKEQYLYEILFVDDLSTDGTAEYIESLSNEFPIRLVSKQGKIGKSYSILQGIREASGDIIAMIDADLQYPPEAISIMAAAMDRFDIVVANRTKRETAWYRTLMSSVYKTIFGKILLSLSVDVQSGLKVFRKDLFDHIQVRTSAWAFDSHFLYKAKRLGCTIGSCDIVFSERHSGQTHVRFLLTAMELVWEAFKLRLSFLPQDIFPFLHYPHQSEYRSQGYLNRQDYLFLPEIFSIRKHIYRETAFQLLMLAGTVTGLIITVSWLLQLPMIIVISAMISAMYLALMIFKIYVIHKASSTNTSINFSQREIAAIKDSELPVYTILIPLYQEAEVIGQIARAMSAIDYPPDKLDIIITLEAYDRETIDAIESAGLPQHFKTLILPDVKPKTKPKALNVAFLHVKGDFFVIYDAEIIPDPDQLKKAYLAFKKFPKIACLQTRLDHYNSSQSWITKLFNAEFSFYYDMFLPGLQKLDFPLPLSGHSTHFRSEVLRQIGCWDPYNVAEDCDVGIRLFRSGFRAGMLNSLSQEEATGDLYAWICQRSRWMKGFIQTTIVHMRHPLRFKDDLGGWRNFFAFLTIVPGSVVLNIVNLVYGILLALWVTTHSPLIQAYFPGPILYISVFSFVVGNFLFTYMNLLGSYRRGRFEIVKYSLLSFVYWFMLAYATIRASIQLIHRPHHWEKTKHGSHLPISTKYAST